MDVTVRMDDREFERKLREYAAAQGMKTGEVVRQQARLISVELSKNTQPWGNRPADRQKGIDAIRADMTGGGDVQKALLVINQPYYGQGRQRKGGRRRRSRSNTVFLFAKDKKAYGVERERYMVTASAANVRKIARANRNRRTGRIPRRRRQVQKQVGNFHYLDQYVAKPQAVRGAVNQSGKMVGFGKAVWASAAARLGGTRGIPAWVTRHVGRAPVTIIDNSHQDTDPHVYISPYDLDYIGRILKGDAVRNAVRVQRNKMTTAIRKSLEASRRRARFARR